MSATDAHRREVPAPESPRVYVVIVNWNRPRISEECLASVFRSDYPSFGVILCDNGSTDGSLASFLRWARSREGGGESPPIRWALWDAEGSERERGGGEPGGASRTLDIVDVGENLGFAGACNAGMRLALARGDFRYVWLLNNDTTVAHDALTALVDGIQRHPGAGFCGSTVLEAGGREDRVQALGGGSYDPWWGRTRLFARDGLLEADAARVEAKGVCAKLDFVVGTSMLVDRAVIETIGLMNEEYFLYFEELDWARRSRGSFSLTFAPESRVLHRVGGTIGSRTRGRDRTLLADYYGIRNRILFTRRHFSPYLPTVYLGLLATMGIRLLRRQPDRAWMVFLLGLWGLGVLGEARVRRRFLGEEGKAGAGPPRAPES